MATARPIWIDETPDFAPGDPPPDGYTAWHAWAEVQHEAGLRQKRCCRCGLFRFPQEMSGVVHESAATQVVRGKPPERVSTCSPVCIKCVRPEDAVAP